GLDLVVLGLLPQAGTYAAGSSRSASGCSCWPRERRSPSSLRAPPMICSVFIRFPTPCLPERPRCGLPRQRFGRRKPRRSFAGVAHLWRTRVQDSELLRAISVPELFSFFGERLLRDEHGGSSGSTRASA